MIIYKKTFENIKTLNCDFTVEDCYYASDNEVIVADGITRDPIGSSDLSTYSDDEFIKSYPRPSGGEIAAKTIVDTFKNSKGALKERLIEGNNKLKEINKKYIKECDYLKNDYYGTVASCIKIERNILHYAYICDCGVIIYDKLGKVKFKTPDDKELYSDPYINKIGIPWHLKEARVIVRRDYRNNLNNIKNGKCISYGALTGETAAIDFIKTGEVTLEKGDTVIVYSDGMVNFLLEKEFIKLVLNFDKEKFENYLNKTSYESYDKYGKKTLVILK